MLRTNVNSLLITTGNIINSKEFKKKPVQSPSEEVFDSINDAVLSWSKSLQKANFEDSDIHIIDADPIKVDKDNRINLKISVKIFLETFYGEDLKYSISQVMKDLDISMIDSLTLSFPTLTNGEKLTLEHMKDLWMVLEKFVYEKKVATIGVSDLETALLIDLYNWSKIKPSINQVNLESCCVMPPEMTAFAKEKDIQLLTHNDPKNLLPYEMLQKILEPALSQPEKWKKTWIVKYSVIIKCRGIIQNKGYLLRCVKDF